MRDCALASSDSTAFELVELVRDKLLPLTCHLATVTGAKQNPYFKARRLERNPPAIDPNSKSKLPSERSKSLRNTVASGTIKLSLCRSSCFASEGLNTRS